MGSRPIQMNASALNESPVRRVGREFTAYYYEDRPHLRLEKDTPDERTVAVKPAGEELESLARVDGLHDRYICKTVRKVQLREVSFSARDNTASSDTSSSGIRSVAQLACQNGTLPRRRQQPVAPSGRWR